MLQDDRREGEVEGCRTTTIYCGTPSDRLIMDHDPVRIPSSLLYILILLHLLRSHADVVEPSAIVRQRYQHIKKHLREQLLSSIAIHARSEHVPRPPECDMRLHPFMGRTQRHGQMVLRWMGTFSLFRTDLGLQDEVRYRSSRSRIWDKGVLRW